MIYKSFFNYRVLITSSYVSINCEIESLLLNPTALIIPQEYLFKHIDENKFV